MKTISAQDFAKQYGQDALSGFGNTQSAQTSQPLFKGPSGAFSGNVGANVVGQAANSVGSAFSGGVAKAKEGFQQAQSGQGKGFGDLVSGVGKMLGGATEAITSPLAPIFAPVGGAINQVGDKISDIPAVQKFANSPAGEKTAQMAGDVANYFEAAGMVAGAPEAKVPNFSEGDVITAKPEVPSETPPAGPSGPKLGGASTYLSNAAKDISPTTEGQINHQVAKALDLTPGDMSTIKSGTGNKVGSFLAQHNLIGQSVEETVSNVKGFFKQNYDAVRAEIAKVPTIYKLYQIPRYIDALKQILKKTQGQAGLESTNVEIDNLLHKQDITLNDVQRVKELFDDYFSLYKKTGDVGEGVAKQGLANIRGTLKTFIESQVKKNTGSDIGELNNRVSTSKAIMDTIENRESVGTKRSEITWRDFELGLGVSVFGGGPIVGIAAVLAKKILLSPTARLRFARYLDGLSDAQQNRLAKEMRVGKVPPEVEVAVNEQAPAMKETSPTNPSLQ